MFHPFSDVIPRRVENILKLWADSWNLRSNNNLNGIQSIVGKHSWSYGITSKENIAVRLCRINHAMMVHNNTPAPPEEGYTVLPLFVRPSVRLELFSSIFLRNYWWQKFDIWSQASYWHAILWEAFLDPSVSYFLFADLAGFYAHWTYMRGYHKWALAHISSCFI